MKKSIDPPGVGVAVLIKHHDKLLLTRRPNLPEPDHWQCAGGFLRAGEDIFACARRCSVETGIRINIIGAGPYTNNLFVEDGLHTVTLYVLAQYMTGTPNHDWQWFDWQKLPQPMFMPVRLLVEKHADWLAENMKADSGR